MFNIEFTAAEPELQDEGWNGLWGCVTLGEYRESFVASLSIWSKQDYEQQWRDAAERLVAGAPSTAFLTSAFQFWWSMWRSGATVRVHEELLTPERLAMLGPSPDLTRAPYELLGEYVGVNEEGAAISEWRIDLADIEAFLARRASS
ncbi:MAG: hypothetical protein ACJ79A_04825 [Gemmatimonadaceae bacterium]